MAMSVLLIVGSVVMMFVIEPLFSSASIALLLLLLLFIHYRSATSSWGYISQALLFDHTNTHTHTHTHKHTERERAITRLQLIKRDSVRQPSFLRTALTGQRP